MDQELEYGNLILDLPDRQKNIARYSWSIFTNTTKFRLNDFPESPFVISEKGLFPISDSFDDILTGNITRVAEKYKLPEGLDRFRREEPVACAFYLINSLHEHLLPPDKMDRYGRYPFGESIQAANDLMEVNYVQDIFDEVYHSITGHPVIKDDSVLMWTHDIDYLYSAWKNDLILAIRAKQYHKIPHILWTALVLPHRWNNIEQILNLEKKQDIRSLFFWLTEQGKSKAGTTDYIDHADYDFKMKRPGRLWDQIKDSDSQNGLHKSAYNTSFHYELQKLPAKVHTNRNHFLKMQLPHHYDQVEKIGLKYDATLGFAEHHGFRNSFGRPFHPFNLNLNRPYRFTEFPLHLMDTTFRTYLNHDLESMTTKMTGFINQHSHSSTIGILLHNSQYNFQDDAEMEIWNLFYTTIQKMPWYLPDDE